MMDPPNSGLLADATRVINRNTWVLELPIWGMGHHQFMNYIELLRFKGA